MFEMQEIPREVFEMMKTQLETINSQLRTIEQLEKQHPGKCMSVSYRNELPPKKSDVAKFLSVK